MTRARVVAGRGLATNPADNDRVVISVGVRDGRVVTIGADQIRVGSITTTAGGESHEVWFKDGAEARALGGETFAACDVARNTALILYKVFIGRSIDECLAVTESELARMAGNPDDDRGCVAVVLEAVRRALIDVQVLALAEAVVNARRLQPTDA